MSEQRIRGIVKLVSKMKEHDERLQIGWALEKNPQKWFNAYGDERELNVLLDNIIQKGNEVEFNFDSLANKVTGLVRTQKAKEDSKNTTSNPKDVVNIKGKDFVTYAGLLKKAHEKGLQSIEILESWVSEDMKMAWCKVRAKFVAKNKISEIKEMFFDGFGSSTPENTGEMTKTHPVEMAHTRAKGRALRDFLNIGTAMLEELKNN